MQAVITFYNDLSETSLLPVWNSLPESVKSSKTLVSFKRKLKTYLFTISF